MKNHDVSSRFHIWGSSTTQSSCFKVEAKSTYKRTQTAQRVYWAGISSKILQRNLSSLTRIFIHWKNIYTLSILKFLGYLNTESKMTIILGGSKHHQVQTVGVGTYGGQVINGILAKAYLTACQMLLQAYWALPQSGRTSQLAWSTQWFLSSGVKAIRGGKAMRKPSHYFLFPGWCSKLGVMVKIGALSIT